MNSSFVKILSQFGNVETDVSFKTLTTFRTGGTAAVVVYPRSVFTLGNIIEACKSENVDYKILGNGSNILASDDYYDGVIIRLIRSLNDYYFDGNTVVAEAGTSLIGLAVKAAEKGLSGLEFACGIPGSIGGAIFMNAGAYKSSMSEVVTEVQVMIDGNLIWLSNDKCEFGYRSSIFETHTDWIITAAKLQLVNADVESIKTTMKNRQEKRVSTQPLNYPSAGSTFRNPENGFAWQFIDNIGYRGKMIGGAQVSEKHSNFLINANNATSNDINQLASEIIEKVKEQYGVELIMEVEKFNWKK